jgi:sec-independent protein translocase protein TatC
MAANPIDRSTMPFWEHIEELRRHLLRALMGFGVALFLGLAVGERLTQFIAAPVERELGQFYDRRLQKIGTDLEAGDPALSGANARKNITHLYDEQQLHELARALGQREPVPSRAGPLELEVGIRPLEQALALGAAERIVGRRPTLSSLSPTETFLVYLKVSMYFGVVLASPWIFFQLWSFVAAGLYPPEKRMVRVYLPVSVGLFLAGVALAEFAILPLALRYLLSFNESMNVEPDLRLSEWLGFATMMPLVFGLCFQLPLVMLFVQRLGIVEVQHYRRHRRLAMFVMAVVAVVLAAAPDWINMMSLTVPLWVLYEFGILLCVWSSRPESEHDEEVPDSSEMVEVSS